MIGGLKSFLKRHWPALRLRVILFAVLFFVAALPGISAIFLRVYENTLVRQTQAELMAQGAALVAAAELDWPGAGPPSAKKGQPDFYRPEGLTLDLRTSPMLPERPPPSTPSGSPDPEALAVAERLGPMIEQTSRTTLASVLLLDRNGQVVYGASAGGSYASLPEVRAAMRGQPQSEFRRIGAYHPTYSFEWLSRASALRIHHARPIIVQGKVVGVLLLSRSARALFRGIYEDRGKILIGVGLILACLVFLSGLVSRGVARPIEALSRAARDVAAGHGEIPETPATAAVEIRALYEDFREMSEAIARRSRYLKDFAGAVSHEFKTPLAGINGAVELLQDHFDEMSEAERRRFLDNISADTARLSQLVTRLLDLARADMARPEAGLAVDLAAPVRRIADAHRNTGFAVDLTLPEGLPKVATPAATIETVLTTLLENARQSGASKARILAENGGDRVVLSVSDDGPGVPTADRERLFEPFFTSHRSDGGTGLGLPIARSLLAASNGRLILADALKGARFEVALPVAEAPQA
jgi:signal transduction histidine kinase